MSAKNKLTPQNVIEMMEVPEHQNVYFVGRKGLRLTFLSQQQRALNLIWALNEVTKFERDTRIIVVGAGLAGLTAAFAAYQLSAKVTLIESKSSPMHLQHGCHLRFIHPHILDWPKEGSADSCTDLPCMNWGAGMADSVADTILAEWSTARKNVEEKFGCEVRRLTLDPHTKSPRVFVEGDNGNFEQECDHLILAIGFGLEKTISSTSFLSYWENDNFGRPIITEPIPRRYLVTGCGDGGLIDAIRLRLQAFDHEKFIYRLVHEVEGLDDIRTRLPDIDEEVVRTLEEGRARGEIALQLDNAERAFGENFDSARMRKRLELDFQGKLLEEEYRKLIIPDELKNLIVEDLRKDTVVFLNSPYASPLNLGSSILNRFLIFLLRLYGGLRYRAGEVAIRPVADGRLFRVSLMQAQFQTEELEVHEVVVRHGPVSLIDRLFPKHIADACRAGAGDLNDLTRTAQYDPETFLVTAGLIARKTAVLEEHRIRTNPLAAKKLFQAGQKPPSSTDHANLGSNVHAYSESFLIDEAFEPYPQQFRSRTKVKSFLVPGTAIQNAGEEASPAKMPKGSGTLGCFLKLESGELGILTTASAIGGRKAALGDKITTPFDQTFIVGTVSHLKLPIPSSPRASIADGSVKLNQFEAAIVSLGSRVNAKPDFTQAHPRAPALKSVYQPASSDVSQTNLIGEKVLKVGAKTNLTWGRIDSVLTICAVYGGDEQYWYEGVFSICGLEDKAFSEPGDGGALVVKEDGTVLGLIIAANKQISFACFVAPILEAFNCSIAY